MPRGMQNHFLHNLDHFLFVHLAIISTRFLAHGQGSELLEEDWTGLAGLVESQV